MFILVGLGNPGPKYKLNRHNVGFILLDALAQEFQMSFKKEESAEVLKTKIQVEGQTEELLLVKPMTYMNLSGEVVQPLMSFYKTGLDKLIVAHDEIDLPFGQVRLQKNRGHGGHNGIRNIHSKVGSDYARLRIGVGRPSNPQMDVADYVLQNFLDQELESLPKVLEIAAEGFFQLVENGFEKAQNHINAMGSV